MLELTLIRHGQAAWPDHGTRADPSLTEAGEAQVRCLKPRLDPITFGAVYCSDARRALRTAAILFPGRNLVVDARLNDDLPGDFEARAAAFRKDLPATGSVAVVSHAGMIGSFLHTIIRASPGWNFALRKTSLTRLEISEAGTRVICVGDSAHLERPWTDVGILAP